MEIFDFNVKSPFDIKTAKAKLLSDKVSLLNSDVYISKDDSCRKCNAKSSIGLMSLNIERNDNLSIHINGQNCLLDANAIKSLFDNGLN